MPFFCFRFSYLPPRFPPRKVKGREKVKKKKKKAASSAPVTKAVTKGKGSDKVHLKPAWTKLAVGGVPPAVRSLHTACACTLPLSVRDTLLTPPDLGIVANDEISLGASPRYKPPNLSLNSAPKPTTKAFMLVSGQGQLNRVPRALGHLFLKHQLAHLLISARVCIQITQLHVVRKV